MIADLSAALLGPWWPVIAGAVAGLGFLGWRLWARWRIRAEQRREIEIEAWRREDAKLDAARRAMDARSEDHRGLSDDERRRRMRDRGIGRS